MTFLAGAIAAENPSANFGQDNGWVIFGKALFIFVFLVLLTLLTIWGERRVVARMQSRPGPNRTGPFGLVQGLADGVKLALKEDIIPNSVDKLVFILAPIISAITCFLAFAVIPFGPEARIPFTDIVTPLQLTDLPVAVLYVLAVAAVGVYGIVLAGWSSGSTYPLLGGLRSLNFTRQYLSMAIAMMPVPQQFALAKANEAFDEAGALKDPKHQAALEAVVGALVRVAAALKSPS